MSERNAQRCGLRPPHSLTVVPRQMLYPVGVSDTYGEREAGWYDAEYADLAMLDEDVPFFLSQLPDGGPLDILEIGVGTGRAAAMLIDAGHRVTGVDSSPAMLKFAAAKGVGAELIEADAAGDLPATLGGRTFDRVCLFFNTFLNFHEPEDQEAVLASAAAVLRPGGRLWLDVFNPDLDLILGGVDGVEDLDPTLFQTDDGLSVMKRVDVRSDLTRQVQHVTYRFEWFEDGERREAERSFEAAWVMPRELIRLLRLCGFAPTALWGGHDGSMLTATSDRIICEAAVVSEA